MTERKNSFAKRKEAIIAAYRKLAEDGYTTKKDMEAAIEELDNLSAADVAVEYKHHVTNNF